ncbi:MAG: hypothetical protein LBL75_03480 [Rickettsiales bacterium]|jgi:hypothetical protein|nr:hypothetical protein [Rickettsiales bacterium]
MKIINKKSMVLQNGHKIQNVLKKNRLKKSGYLGWIKHEVFNENKYLIPQESGISQNVLNTMLNYTYMTNQQKALDYIYKSNTQIDRVKIYKLHKMLCKNTSVSGATPRCFNCQLGAINIYPPNYTIAAYKMEGVYDLYLTKILTRYPRLYERTMT